MAPRRRPALGEQPGLGAALAVPLPPCRAGLHGQGGCWGRERCWAGGFWQPAGGGLWSGGLREGAPRELSVQEPSGERTRAEPRAGAARPVNARSDAGKPGGRGRAIGAAGGREQAGRERRRRRVRGSACCGVSVRDTAPSPAQSGALRIPLLRGRGAWGGAGGPRVGGTAPVSRCMTQGEPLQEGEGRGEGACSGSGGRAECPAGGHGRERQCWHGEG